MFTGAVLFLATGALIIQDFENTVSQLRTHYTEDSAYSGHFGTSLKRSQ